MNYEKRCTRVESDASETNNRVDCLQSKLEYKDKLVNGLFAQVTSLKNQCLVSQHTEKKTTTYYSGA